MALLFKKTRELEGKITTFLMNIMQAGFLFTRAYAKYFENGVSADFLELRQQVSLLEAENDSLRRDVESQLYVQMLLPDMRSDILALIEGCDKIINKYESDLILLSVEKPKIPVVLKEDVMRLIEVNVSCVEALISGFKAFMAGSGASDFIEQVYRLEHQVDLQAMDLKQVVFQSLHLPLARQMQLKEFIYGIEKISDMAEDTTDMISVMVVKHAI